MTQSPVYVLLAILAIFLGLLVGVPMLTSVLEVVSRHSILAAQAIQPFVSRLGERALGFLTRDATLTLPQGVYLVAGSVLFLSAATICAVTDLDLAILTIAPLLGGDWALDANHWLFRNLGPLTGLSVVSMAAIFMIAVSDLVRWSSITQFAYIESPGMRAFALLTSGICLVGVVWLVVSLGLHRDEAVQAMSSSSYAPVLLHHTRTILVSFAVLLVVGTGFGLTSLETFAAALVALVVSIVALFAWLLGLLLLTLKFASDCLIAALNVLSSCTDKTPKAFLSQLRHAQNFGSGVLGTMWNAMKSAVSDRSASAEDSNK